ncbi:IS481 family transposase [Thiorhodospira sibirica]|uniref:IS481 family transposase n=1 Tax=Thiorhodospira sibirica TaxID=154347 RepID=UPI00022C0B5F|nr:IS481 family transposase [Thiorhodospira sibirica]
MQVRLHKNARTTPAIRAELKASSLPTKVLARQYGLHPATVTKWRKRDSTADASHCPKRLQTNLSPVQEAVVVELRKTLLLPLDDLLAVTHEFINDKVSRSGLDRCLRRHGVSNLKALKPVEENSQPTEKKTFKDYEPGFVHVDVKYLPRMPDESSRQYLFVAIDRATRWVYVEILPAKSAKHAQAFLKRLIKAAPFRITKILTDNGKEFTDRFCVTGQRQPTGKHLFDSACQRNGIEHRLTKPRHPQTNGMVERFNGRIAEVLQTTRFQSGEQLSETITRYVKLYNQHIPQRALGHVAPIQSLRQWYQMKPELFVKRPYNLAGLDI